jgi:hypothetical protein
LQQNSHGSQVSLLFHFVMIWLLVIRPVIPPVVGDEKVLVYHAHCSAHLVKPAAVIVTKFVVSTQPTRSDQETQYLVGYFIVFMSLTAV